ncbi:hypothetical protein COLO4_28052 [Corchorus olitorius]|uniref:Uncharacterized protein n=1 Tax=Corchorus olitorius TaxID=93759 RepID=A0A1R3HN32_9ROSI|nr:hypothetical protein COLO4_28052 [Corchorus olitorius]
MVTPWQGVWRTRDGTLKLDAQNIAHGAPVMALQGVDVK